jgi:hypothetical protein
MRNWTLEEETFIIDTNATLTAKEQALRLGRPYQTLLWRRQELIRAGRLDITARLASRPWLQNDKELLRDMIQDGRNAAYIARKLNRGLDSIYWAANKFCGGIELLRNDGLARVQTPVQVAAMLGMASETIRRWIKKGYITASKNVVYHRTNGRKPHNKEIAESFLVTDDSLMQFLQDCRYWGLWRVEKITDRDWREYAQDIRAGAHAEWLSTAQVAQRLRRSQKRIVAWRARGKFTNVRTMRVHGQYLFWSEDIARFVPPLNKALENAA